MTTRTHLIVIVACLAALIANVYAAGDAGTGPTPSWIESGEGDAAEAMPAEDGPEAGAPAETGSATGVEEPVAAAERDPLGTGARIVRDIRAGNWRMAAAGLLALLMLLLGKVRARIPWFAGDRGGAILVGVLGLGGALSSALATSTPIGPELLVGALGVTWTAVGGYSWIRRLLKPAD